MEIKVKVLPQNAETRNVSSRSGSQKLCLQPNYNLSSPDPSFFLPNIPNKKVSKLSTNSGNFGRMEGYIEGRRNRPPSRVLIYNCTFLYYMNIRSHCNISIMIFIQSLCCMYLVDRMYPDIPLCTLVLGGDKLLSPQ